MAVIFIAAEVDALRCRRGGRRHDVGGMWWCEREDEVVEVFM
jgi:hypothetical protein